MDKMYVGQTDNRDTTTTTLRLNLITPTVRERESGYLVEVDVDPWDLFENMLDNSAEAISKDPTLFMKERSSMFDLIDRMVGILKGDWEPD